MIFLLACATEDVAPSTSSPDTTDDTAPASWLTLPVGCASTDTTSSPALRLIGADQHTQIEPGEWFIELVDVEYDTERLLVWGVGQGGLMAFDVSDPAAPSLVGRYPLTDENQGRLYRVELGDADQLYATHRDQGLYVYNISDPTAISQQHFVSGSGLEGMARVDDRLYVVSLGGSLLVYDLSDKGGPVLSGEMSGLGSPWDIVVDGDIGYISDNTSGVVVVDLSEPDAPTILTAVAVGGGVQDIALADGALYAAAGGAGIVTLDRSDPALPVVVGSLSYSNPVQSVAVEDDLLWAVDQADVIALDISAPLAPRSLGTAATEQYAMHVTAGGGHGWVGDWSLLESWLVDADTTAPDLELGVSTLLLRTDGGTASFSFSNTGAGTLRLTEASTGDDRVTVSFSTDTLAPGEAGEGLVTFSGGTLDDGVELCIASNDPDGQTTIALATGGGEGDLLGLPAPDFALTDLDGVTWRLSEQLGHPVVLVYFATW